MKQNNERDPTLFTGGSIVSISKLAADKTGFLQSEYSVASAATQI